MLTIVAGSLAAFSLEPAAIGSTANPDSTEMVPGRVTSSPASDDDPVLTGGAYNTSIVARFDINENVTSNINKRDFHAMPTNYHYLSTPTGWPGDSASIGLQPYYKEQKISDPTFSQPANEEWRGIAFVSGTGTISQSFIPNPSTPQYTRIYMKNLLYSSTSPGFRKDNYAFWEQTESFSNSQDHEVVEGSHYQGIAQGLENFGGFYTNPGFSTDLNSPYGGTNRPDDEISLVYETGTRSLIVNMLPATTVLGGNPSAAWWHTINIPYEADYVQMKISWSIDAASTFEALDLYQVCARVNDEYIDGRPVSGGGMMVSKDDTLPYTGSATNLMMYSNPQYIVHPRITRTYNVTRLVDGLKGVNKFDFGAWAYSPTRAGDPDRIVAKFHYIEISYNTSDKYEVARLDFDYQCINNLTGNVGTIPPAFLAVNRASVSLRLEQEDSGSVAEIRVLPFKSMTVYRVGMPGMIWIHVSHSIPQKYKALLAEDNLRASIGVVFEKDYYEPISHTILLDNITLAINYAYDSIGDAQLQMEVDNTGWNDVTIEQLAIDTSGWTAGQDHSFRFQSGDALHDSQAFLNLQTSYKAHRLVMAMANASYSTSSANAQSGTWSIRYDNTATFTPLIALNATPNFNISEYSISYLDIPAFDGEGSRSTNWRVTAAYAPSGANFSQAIVRFNHTVDPYLQHLRLEQALAQGTWTIIATQPNYITNIGFVDATSYLGAPAYYKNSLLNYTVTLHDDVPAGNYSVSLLDGSGAVLAGYPAQGTSAGQVFAGSTALLSAYPVGKYYLELRWNDTGTLPGIAHRFGASRNEFYILNATVAGFVSTTTSVQSGTTANFTTYYKTIESLPITGATIFVFENSTGTYKAWGMSWFGSYLVGPVTSPSPGNYSVPLLTTGAPSGTYHVIFAILKQFHQPRNLTFSLTITTTNQITALIAAGATWNGTDYNLDPDNVPYVNDTMNSVVQVFLAQQGSGTPIQNGIVVGRIGATGAYVTAVEIFKVTNKAGDLGKYNLTLDTTGLNATLPGQTERLSIMCTASGYDPVKINVTITIDKCPTKTTLNTVPPVNEGGSITLLGTLVTLVNPAAPIPYDHGTVTFAIYQGTTEVLAGSLSLLMSGVYTSMVTLDGIAPGNYTVKLSASAFNCQPSSSANASFTIYPRLATNLSLSVQESVRILKPFQIGATLSYLTNGTGIPNKLVTLRIVIGTSVDFLVTTTTDSTGSAFYEYIVDARYLSENLTVTASFTGDASRAPDTETTTRLVLDRIPISITILESPATLRTGYPAYYRIQVNITDPSESLLNRLIVLVAWYENQNLTPFLTQQLRTDINGITNYTIPEIAGSFANMTVAFEYQGSTTVAYNLTMLSQTIMPKWTSTFTVAPLPGIIRYGQTIVIALTFTCENASLSLVGLPVTFTFLYGINPSSTVYVQQDNTLALSYTIPEGIGNGLNVSISFPGSSKVEGYSEVLAMVLHPKVQVILQFVDPVQPSYMTGTYVFSVLATDEGGQHLGNLPLRFSVSGEEQVVTTNAQGIASVSIDLNDIGNEVVLKVSFVEAGEYEGAILDSPSFRVLDEWLYFLDMLPYIGIALGIVLAIAISIHRGVVVPRRNRARALLSRMYHRLSDVENIQYLLVISKGGGVPMFSKSLAEVPIDESLVSGFLSAISSFGAEISTKMKGDVKGGLEELSYQQFKIILHEGQHVRVALLLLRRPSDTLKERLRTFTVEFEKRFHAQVTSFKGEILQDMVVTPVIEQSLESDLLYPHRIIDQKAVGYVKELPRKSVAKRVLGVARSDEFDSIFYIRELINNLKTKGVEEINSFDAIQKLKADQVVFAINPRTNYIIEQLKPYIKMLTQDDRATLFAIAENNTDGMAIQKFFNKNKINLSTELAVVLARLKSMRVIEENNHINATGSAIVTLLRLIPEL